MARADTDIIPRNAGLEEREYQRACTSHNTATIAVR